MRSWRSFMKSSQQAQMMRRIPYCWRSSKNSRHNGTWQMWCLVFTSMASKRQSGWNPRNVTPCWSRYPSGFEMQTRDNGMMVLAPSTSNDFSQLLQNFAVLSFLPHRQMYCLARSIESSLLSQNFCSSAEIQNYWLQLSIWKHCYANPTSGQLNLRNWSVAGPTT